MVFCPHLTGEEDDAATSGVPVYTPPQLADAMVQAIDANPHDHWLDPCMGPAHLSHAFGTRVFTKSAS